MLSLLTDMLFLHRFYRDENPWRNLRKIYASAISDFKPAGEIGWTLIENKRTKRKRIPAEDLPEFNRNIVGVIEVMAEFRSIDRSQ